MLHSECGAAAESKEESIRDRNGNQWTEGPVEERNGSEMRKVKQRSASIFGSKVPSKGTRRWGRIWIGSGIGLARQGIC